MCIDKRKKTMSEHFQNPITNTCHLVMPTHLVQAS